VAAAGDSLRRVSLEAEAHLDRDEFFAASTAPAEAFELVGPDEHELFHGIDRLAAAGYRHQTGEAERAARQLAHPRRRLSSFPDYDEQYALSSGSWRRRMPR
jgi:hypothetical protein